MRKNLLFLIFLSIFFASCAENSILKSNIPDDTGKSEKHKQIERKVEKRDINLPSDSPLLKGEGLLDSNNLFGNFGGGGETFTFNTILFNTALDKISFMPLASVDARSGVIVTDWYSFDEGKTRIKINMRIIDEEMNDDSLSVNLFKQSLQNSLWVDQGMDEEQANKIKNSVLSTARDLKIATEL